MLAPTPNANASEYVFVCIRSHCADTGVDSLMATKYRKHLVCIAFQICNNRMRTQCTLIAFAYVPIWSDFECFPQKSSTDCTFDADKLHRYTCMHHRKSSLKLSYTGNNAGSRHIKRQHFPYVTQRKLQTKCNDAFNEVNYKLHEHGSTQLNAQT